MPAFPDEDDLLSLFACEPILFDQSKDLPFYYNKAKYHFNNHVQEFDVTISPSYGEVKIQVKELGTQNLIALLDLKRVDKFEITEDRKDRSSILLTIMNDETQQSIQIEFKPRFQMIFKEHLTR